MQPLAGVADERRQTPLDVQVHVLEVAATTRTRRAAISLADRRQAALDVAEVLRGDDADGREHACVGERARDVGVGQAPVERRPTRCSA